MKASLIKKLKDITYRHQDLSALLSDPVVIGVIRLVIENVLVNLISLIQS